MKVKIIYKTSWRRRNVKIGYTKIKQNVQLFLTYASLKNSFDKPFAKKKKCWITKKFAVIF